ncbi:MAG: hypothetical protein ACTSXL_00140 [Alphaproteobacteria bacterium]
MKRILFLSFLVISTLAVAMPQRFTSHLHQVSMQDCDRVLAKIVTVESKDRDLKSHLDEVPQCVTFFTERLTRESFKDKDYRRACSPLLQDFCQQHRYLSLPTLTENYKTNKLKVAGSMGLGYMFGKTTSRTVKKYLHRLKKTEESKAKSQGAECYERLKSNQEIAKMCEEKAPQDCIEGWRLKDKRCIVEADVCNEAIMPKLVCECIPDRSKLAGPPEWEYKIDGDNVECIDKREKDCDKLNGVNTKPYRVAGKPNTGYFSGKRDDVNSELHIIKWKYDSADTSRGIKGCYVNLCEEGYKVDSWELGCKKKPKKVTPNPNPNPNPNPQSCVGFGAANGRAEDIVAVHGGGHVFGSPTTRTCRTVCDKTYASDNTKATNGGGSGVCSAVASVCPNVALSDRIGLNVIGWEYRAVDDCSALCKPGYEYDKNNVNDKDKVCKEQNQIEKKVTICCLTKSWNGGVLRKNLIDVKVKIGINYSVNKNSGNLGMYEICVWNNEKICLGVERGTGKEDFTPTDDWLNCSCKDKNDKKTTCGKRSKKERPEPISCP